MGVFGPRNPLFQEMGIRGSVWGRGNCNLLYALVDSVSVRLKKARVSKNAFKHSYTVECGNRLRVGVRAKTAPACRGLRVGPSKLPIDCQVWLAPPDLSLLSLVGFWGMSSHLSGLSCRMAQVFAYAGLSNAPDPEGPNLEKIQDHPPGLKFSSEIEDFKRATHQTPIFVGNSEGRD